MNINAHCTQRPWGTLHFSFIWRHQTVQTDQPVGVTSAAQSFTGFPPSDTASYIHHGQAVKSSAAVDWSHVSATVCDRFFHWVVRCPYSTLVTLLTVALVPVWLSDSMATSFASALRSGADYSLTSLCPSWWLSLRASRGIMLPECWNVSFTKSHTHSQAEDAASGTDRGPGS